MNWPCIWPNTLGHAFTWLATMWRYRWRTIQTSSGTTSLSRCVVTPWEDLCLRAGGGAWRARFNRITPEPLLTARTALGLTLIGCTGYRMPGKNRLRIYQHGRESASGFA